MVSQSWDGKRVYFTSSLLANWDKKGDDNEQFLRAYSWDGKDLELKFVVDFQRETRPRASHEIFGSDQQSLTRSAGTLGVEMMKLRARFLGALCTALALGGSSRQARRSPRRRAPVESCQCPEATELDHIQRIPFAIVLEGNHVPHVLTRYTTDAITLLSFFYSICTDPKGCPLAWEAFEQVRKAILTNPDHYGRVRLVFLSLDPAHDTPSMLKNFAKAYDSGAAVVPWHFLTSYSYLFVNPCSASWARTFPLTGTPRRQAHFEPSFEGLPDRLSRAGFVRFTRTRRSIRRRSSAISRPCRSRPQIVLIPCVTAGGGPVFGLSRKSRGFGPPGGA